MVFDSDNSVVRLCAKGMDLEGAGRPDEAGQLFLQAWNEAVTDLERFTAAHYVARQQPSIRDKLEWDRTALAFALKLGDAGRPALPSLYLNIAKCHEDLQEMSDAVRHYKLAQSHASSLDDDGYGKMIRSGIQSGLNRASMSQRGT